MRADRLLASQDDPPSTYLWPRWLFLRGLGLIFLSAFFSLAFQIHGLIGARGILPAGEYLHDVRGALGPLRAIWYGPTPFWLGSDDDALGRVPLVGIAQSLLV